MIISMIVATLFLLRMFHSGRHWLSKFAFAPTSRFLKSSEGTTSMEYAVVLALIAATLVLAGQAMHGSVSSSLVAASAAVSSAVTTPAQLSTRANAPVASTPTTAVPYYEAWLQVSAWSCLVLATLLAIYTRYRNARLARAVATVDCDPEPTTDQPENPGYSKRQEIQRLLRQSMGLVGDHAMKVQHVMSQRILSVTPHVLVNDLKQSLARAGFRHLLVLRSAELVGVISDRDLHTRSGRSAGQIMTRSPITVTSETSVTQALSIMLSKRISSLPVVDNGVVRGILTTTDAIITLQCLLRLIDQEIQQDKKHPEHATLPDLLETSDPSVIGALSIASHLTTTDSSMLTPT